MSESPCIYCLNDASSAKGREHIIPESLGYKDTLPQGYVCDKCNEYFGSSLDRSVINNRMIALYIGTEGIPGKKGKPRRNIGSRLSFSPYGHFKLMLGPVTITPETRRADFRVEQNEEFNELHFARGIHKIAFNCFAGRWGHREALHPRFNNLRKYIREPGQGELWTYAVKESQSTGEFVVNFHKTKWGEVIELRLLCLDFLVSLTGWERDVENKLRRDNIFIIRNKGQWKASSLLGLQ